MEEFFERLNDFHKKYSRYFLMLLLIAVVFVIFRIIRKPSMYIGMHISRDSKIFGIN